MTRRDRDVTLLPSALVKILKNIDVDIAIVFVQKVGVKGIFVFS